MGIVVVDVQDLPNACRELSPMSLICSLYPRWRPFVSGVVSALMFLILLSPPGGWAQDSEATAPAEAAATPAPSRSGTIRVARANTPIEQILAQIAQMSGKNVAARGKAIGQPISIILRDVPLEQALQQIASQRPGLLVYKPEDQPDTFEIWDQESYRTEVLPKLVRQKVFVPREITAEEASKALQGVLTPNIGSVAFDPRSNKVIVTDLPYVLELCQRLIEQIDVKFITRVFYISHADVNSIAEKLGNLKSSAAPSPEVDERTHQIIVRDRLEVIRQMELLVETLDIGPDIRVYDLNNIGFEGADLEELQTALDRIITTEAFYQINPRSGKLLLEDVPEVHEKVEKILMTLDAPARQVLIQAEAVETQFSDGLNYGIDYTLSDDLFGAVVDGLTGRTVGAAAGAGERGWVPTGSGPFTKKTLGFVDYRREFPITRVSGEGISSQLLMKNAFISLRAAMRDSRTRVLQQPRVIVENQKETRLTIGQSIPYFTGGGFVDNNNNNNNVSSNNPNQQLLEVGLTLNIRPTILNNGMIQMEVELTNSTPIIQTQQFAGQEFTGVGKNEQAIETTLRIPSGETRVIGGLVADQKSEVIGGVPGLVKIPMVGPVLFGSYDRDTDANTRRNLLIFLTPTVIDERPDELVKFKGRLMENPEDAVDEFLGAESQPRSKSEERSLPIGAENTNRRVSAREALESLPPSDSPSPESATLAAEVMARMERVAAAEEAPETNSAASITLRRARVEIPEGETPMGVSRIPAPSGSLAIPGRGTSSSPSAPSGGPTARGIPSGGAPPAVMVSPPSPGSGTVPVAIQPAQSAPAQPIISGAPPRTETPY
jgi:type II secretory pathway component GspD/PulD (secretin)